MPSVATMVASIALAVSVLAGAPGAATAPADAGAGAGALTPEAEASFRATNPRAWSSSYGSATQSLAVTRQYSSGSLPATARQTATFSPSGSGPVTCWLQLNVLGSASTTGSV